MTLDKAWAEQMEEKPIAFYSYEVHVTSSAVDVIRLSIVSFGMYMASEIISLI